jgi:hypothetical protein
MDIINLTKTHNLFHHKPYSYKLFKYNITYQTYLKPKCDIN